MMKPRRTLTPLIVTAVYGACACGTPNEDFFADFQGNLEPAPRVATTPSADAEPNDSGDPPTGGDEADLPLGQARDEAPADLELDATNAAADDDAAAAEPEMPEATPDAGRCDVSLELSAANGDEGFAVPPVREHRECFYVRAPPGPVQVVGFRPVVGDARVLHRWLVYASDDPNVADGAHAPCPAGASGDLLLGGGARATPAYELPPDVGLDVPDDAVFILELQYRNPEGLDDAVDASGVSVCLTRELRPHVAAVHWLGTENFFLGPGENEAGSTCTPNAADPIVVFGVTPHMGALGVRSRLVLERADGGSEMLLDAPFDFEAPARYPAAAVVQPGDRLRASCTWNNDRGIPTGFGTAPGDEQCYLFTLAYPAGALDTGSDRLLGVLFGGDNRCMN